MPPNGTTEAPEPALRPVWDLPIRLFHWLLAALIGFSWWSADNGQIGWHIWSGLAILTLLIFRLLWGLVGSSTARFANFVRGPRVVRAYLRDRRSWRVAGHTPLGALSVLALLLATAAQVGLGLVAVDEDGLNEGPLARLVSIDTSEAARDFHADMFDVLLVLIALHVATILAYRLLQGRKLTKAMFSGRAALGPGIEPMRPGRGWAAAACLLAALAVTRWIVAGGPPLARLAPALDRAAPRGHIAAMLIRTEQTPNPATRKFLPGETVMEAGSRDFPDLAAAEASPLASALFATGLIEGVFFGRDFISVTAAPGVAWDELEPEVVGMLLDHFVSGAPLFNAGTAAGIEVAAAPDFDEDPADSEIIEQIRELIETRVRPAVAQDGGDIVYRGYKDGRLYLAMQGACHGCPSSELTLKRGIENLIRHYVPEVETVEAV